MRHRLRTLERTLVRERTELAVQNHVDKLINDWDLALGGGDNPPDPIEFMRKLTLAGFRLPTRARAHNYLDECRARDLLPDRDKLIYALLPWARPRDTLWTH